MTLADVINEIKDMAMPPGLTTAKVRFVDVARRIPPKLHYQNGVHVVVVSAKWIRTRRPKWWAALAMAKLLDNKSVTFYPTVEPEIVMGVDPGSPLKPQPDENAMEVGFVVDTIEVSHPQALDDNRFLRGPGTWHGTGHILPKSAVAGSVFDRLTHGHLIDMKASYRGGMVSGQIIFVEGETEWDGTMRFKFKGHGPLIRTSLTGRPFK